MSSSLWGEGLVWLIGSGGSTGVAWGGFTPKKPRTTPQATPNENMNFGTYGLHCLYENFWCHP